MKNFIFKSNESDLQKMFSILDNLQKNMLYVTYRLDLVLKKVSALNTDNGLQKQVDEYFEDDSKDIPDEKFEDKPGDIKWSSDKS